MCVCVPVSATFSLTHSLSLCVCVCVWLCAYVLLMTSRTILFHPISALSGTNFGFFDLTRFAFTLVRDRCGKAKTIWVVAVRRYVRNLTLQFTRRDSRRSSQKHFLWHSFVETSISRPYKSNTGRQADSQSKAKQSKNHFQQYAWTRFRFSWWI